MTTLSSKEINITDENPTLLSGIFCIKMLCFLFKNS